MQSMSLIKLKTAVAAAMVLAALGLGGLAYHAAYGPAPAQAADAKPNPEVEALRKEVELLKRSLELALDKVKAQEEELRALKAHAVDERKLDDLVRKAMADWPFQRGEVGAAEDFRRLWLDLKGALPDAAAMEAVKAAEELRSARDPEAKRKALAALAQALEKLQRKDKDGDPKPRKN
jgi:hypothetical protein